MNRVVHFEVHSADPARTAAFYRDVFGWEIAEWIIPGVEVAEENRYWLVTTGPEGEPGINGGIVPRRGPAPAEGQPVNAYVCTLDVASVDECLDKVVRAGGSVALPRMPIRGVGWLAYGKDTEGNLFGMMQRDETAG
jgi:uncharacterized protein